MTKMKTTLRLFVAGTLLLIASLMSCNPNHPTPGVPSSYKVKQIITTFADHSVDTTSITYDAMGRVIRVQPFINGRYEATYEFYGDSMYIDAYNNGNNDAWGHLNAQGYLVSSIDYPTGCGNCTGGNFDIQYTYDNAGFLTQMQVTAATATRPYIYYFTWIDSSLSSISADSGSYAVSNTYYPNSTEYRDNGLETIWEGGLNLSHSGLDQFYLFGRICGRHSKQLLKTSITPTFTYNYSYTFDQYGRVTTQTVTTPNGTNVQRYTYY